jgi:apolipoprotein N-acyltransferase
VIQGFLGRSCHYLTALVAGALLPLTMAPWNLWGLAIISLALFAYLLKRNPDKPLLTSLSFGLGLFGTGASWVFVSIHTYGNTGFFLALLLTSIFVLALAMLFALPWYLLRYCKTNNLEFIIGFAGLWVLGEWLRGWLFTGFPWLYVGYGQLDSWLSGWLPLTGVLGAGFLLALFSALLSILRKSNANKWGAIAAAALSLIWGGGYLLQKAEWTEPSGSLNLTLVQPNIPMESKWDPAFRQPIIDRLMGLTEAHWNSDLIIWPEAAIPLVSFGQAGLLENLDNLAAAQDTVLVTGRLLYEPESETYYNSLLALGEGEGDYHKHQLVPFGEYVPFENQLRGLIDFFDLPNSVISVGQSSDPLLVGENIYAAAAICYEIAYASLVAKGARESQLILTVSNDAWFGRSIGPDQHLQIARARAVENAKPVARSTNNGITALIDASGNILEVAPRFESYSLSGTLELRSGTTPFGTLGHWPIVMIGVLSMLVAIRPWEKQPS